MADAESDQHLRIFKCLVDTGADVLRNALETKVLKNKSISFKDFLHNNKHQFYHQFEKKRSNSCCSKTSHGCSFTGNMDKKIFYKVFTKTALFNTTRCLDRFEIKPDISVDDLDLSDLNFFLWSSNMLTPQKMQSLQSIMSVRSAICHPSSLHSYSESQLENFWLSLENDVLLFAEPCRYKNSIQREIKALKNNNFSISESANIIEEIRRESDKITRTMQQDSQITNDGTRLLLTEQLKNCIRDINARTKSLVTAKLQELKESSDKTVDRSTKDIKCEVIKDGIITRNHNEEQLKSFETRLRDHQTRYYQDVLKKISEEEEISRKHNEEQLTRLREAQREDFAEIMIGCFKTFVGNFSVYAAANMQTEHVTASAIDRNIAFKSRITNASMTPANEERIINNLSSEIHLTQERQLLYLQAKKQDSIELEIVATSGILANKDTLRLAILTLLKEVMVAGEVETCKEEQIHVILTFNSPLTEDEQATVRDLLTNPFRNETQSLEETLHIMDNDNTSSISDDRPTDGFKTCMGTFGKLKINLEMNQEKIEELADTVDAQAIYISSALHQSSLTKKIEKKALENLPSEIHVPLDKNNQSDPYEKLTLQIIEKKLNNFILKLKATSDIFKSVKTFKLAILTLVEHVLMASGTIMTIEHTVSVNLKFESSLTKDQIAVVQCLFSNKSNDAKDDDQLFDEYRATEDVTEFEWSPEDNIFSEQAVETYTKAEGQKGLAIIITDARKYFTCIDPTQRHLELLEFEVISLNISELSSLSRIFEERIVDDFYCIVCFIGFLRNKWDGSVASGLYSTVGHFFRNKPKIYMSFKGSALDFFDNLYMEPDTLLVSLKTDTLKHAKGEYLGESSFVHDFDKVLGDNRFEDIIDMLTRTYGRQSIHNNWLKFETSLTKKFLFL